MGLACQAAGSSMGRRHGPDSKKLYLESEMIFLRRVMVAALLLAALPPCGYGEGVSAPVDSSITAGTTVAAGNIPDEADIVGLAGQATFKFPGDDDPTPISDRILPHRRLRFGDSLQFHLHLK